MYYWIKYWFLRFFRPNSRVTLEYRLFNYLNKERKNIGLWTLFFEYDLRSVARKHSQDMARNNYFDHNNLKGYTPKKRFENDLVSETVAGENLAMNRGFPDPTLKAHVGLMNSPGHKANILSKSYNCVGIGLAISVDKTFYFTQNFSFRVFRVLKFSRLLLFSNYIKIKIKRTKASKSHNEIRILVKNILDEVVHDNTYEFLANTTTLKIPLNQKGKFTVKLVDTVSSTIVNKFEVQKIF